MTTIADIRQQYPQYNDMSDQQLADAMHAKFYSDMPRDQFNQKIGFNQTTASAGSVTDDIAKSLPTGIVKGLANTAAMVGDAYNFVMGDPRNTYNAVAAMRGKPQAAFATNDQMASDAAARLTGDYKPQTALGHAAQTAGEFAPLALTAPEGALAKLLSVAAPSAGSELGYQLAKGTPYESLAQLGGSILGGGLSGIRPNAGAMAERAAARSSIPTIGDLRSAASAGYRTADGSPMVITQSAIQNLASGVKSNLAQEAFHPGLQPKTAAAFDALQTAANDPNAQGTTLTGLQTLRRLAGKAANLAYSKGEKDDARLASGIVDQIDDFADNLKPNDVLGGQVDQSALDALKVARSDWATASKAQTIQDLIERADVRGGRLQTIDDGRALRNQFGLLAENKTRMARFSPAEQDYIRKVASGGPVENITRLLGKLSPDNYFSGIGEGASAVGALAAGGGPAALVPLGIGAVGLGSKVAARAITGRNAELASQIVRNGGRLPNMPPAITYTNPYPGFLPGMFGRRP